MSSTSTAAGSVQAPPSVPLLRNWRFQTLCVGSGAALLGVYATDVAYPLIILAMTGSPALAGVFGLVQAAASVLFTLPAGQLVDRYDRRRIQIAAECVRVTATASVALAFALHRVTFVQLLVVGALVGGAQPFVGAARMLTVRAVVRPEQLSAALTQDEVRVSVAELTGPPLGGLLYGIARILPFLLGTLGFVLSLSAAVAVRPDGASGAPRGAESDGGMFAGVGALWQDRTLRPVVLLLFAFNVAGVPLTLAAVYQLHRQSAPSWSIGLALAGSAVGGLIGAALVRPLHRRFRPGTLLLVASGWAALTVALLGLVSGPWQIGLVLLGTSLGSPAIMVLLDVLIFRQVADGMRGRTIAATMSLMGLGVPLGSGLGGLLLQYLGGTGALLVLGSLLAGATVWAERQSGLRAAVWPAS